MRRQSRPRAKSLVASMAVAAVLAIGGVARDALAALAVDWGGQYVSGSVLFQNGSVAARNYGGFSGGNPTVISPATSYSGTSGTFYGQVSWPTEGTGTSTGFGGQIVNNNSTDRIELKRGLTNLSSLLLWKQSDFLNGLGTGNTGFDSTSTVTMNINTYVAFNAGRVVIRLSGTPSLDGYYISQQTPFDAAGLKSANLTSLTWLAYNPASSLDTFGAATNLLANGVIPHVSEVGFYARSNSASTDATALRLDSFEVSAAAVPEPATAALALGGLVAFAGLRRRRV